MHVLLRCNEKPFERIKREGSNDDVDGFAVSISERSGKAAMDGQHLCSHSYEADAGS